MPLAYDAFVDLGGDLGVLARERLSGDRRGWAWECRALDLLALLERRPDLPASPAQIVLTAATDAGTASIRRKAYEVAVRLRGPEAARPALSDRARKTRAWAEAVLRGDLPASAASSSSREEAPLFDRPRSEDARA